MRRSGPCRAFREVFRQSWLIALTVAVGCAHLDSDLSDRLARRALPVELEADRATGPPQGNARSRGTSDTKVQPAVAAAPVQGSGTSTPSDRSSALPPALVGPPRRLDSDGAQPTATSLPNDSDDATLDAISTNGKPVSLPEAIKLAFRHQPRLRAQLESIAQARGLEQIAFSTFLPIVGANYDVGEFSLGVGGAPIRLSKGLPGFSFVPGVGALPFGLNVGTSFELAELKIQWLLLDFGRRLGRYEQAKLASEVAQLQTDRAYQTVANEVAVAYYNVLRSQALRRTAQDAFRRAEEELADARKREREGVVEREIVLRSEVQLAEIRQQLHASTEAEFVALAGFNLAVGLKCNEPIKVTEPPEIPPLAISLADCLQTAVRERREFYVVQRTVEIAVQGGRVARADLRPSHRRWHLVRFPAAVQDRHR